MEEVEEEGLVCNKKRLRMRKREGRGAAEANAGGIGGEGKAKPTVVALRLLGQLGLVDLVLSVGHDGDVLAGVLVTGLLFTVAMMALVSALALLSTHCHKMEPPSLPSPARAATTEVVVTGLSPGETLSHSSPKIYSPH